LLGWALGFSGCTGFHPLALREPGAVLADSNAESARVEAAVSELENPLLPPVTVDLRDGLGPLEAAVLAAALNPELVAERDARREAGAEVLAAGLLPNPVLGFEGLQPYGSGTAGLHFLQAFRLSIDTSTLVTRGLARRCRGGSADEVDLGIAWQEGRWAAARASKPCGSAGRAAGSTSRAMTPARAEASGGAERAEARWRRERGRLGAERVEPETARCAARARGRRVKAAAALATLLGLPPADPRRGGAGARAGA
jgi:hypothetical protein